MWLAGEIPPLLSIAFNGAFSSECHPINSIKHKPLMLTIGVWPAVRTIRWHQHTIHLKIRSHKNINIPVAFEVSK